MRTTTVPVVAACAVLLAGGSAAQARNAAPKRYSPGPPAASLSKLVAATGANASDAAAARFAYLRKLDSHAQALATARLNGDSVAAAARREGATVSPAGSVLVDVYVNGDVDAAAAALRQLGMRVDAVSRRAPQRMVEGWLPAGALTTAAGLAETRAVIAVVGQGTNTGTTLSQGDATHHGPAARALGPTGTGVKVGIISNSINRAGGGVAGSQGTGDLPAGVTVLTEGPPGSSDEGRAMAEIVYDTAPGITNMYFTTGTGGAASRAAGIANLVSQGVQVVADDTFQITEPFFQDGVVAQAVDAAKAAGVTYLVSAGNRARQSWEGTYAPVPDPRLLSPTTADFDTAAAVDTVQTIGTFTNRTVFVSLQWDEPFGAASTDLAVDVYGISGGTPTPAFTVDTDNIATGAPSEFTNITVTGTATIGIGIRRVAGTRNPFMKYIVGGTPTFSIAEHATNSGAIDPDASSARGALTVAASNFATPATPEALSSRGPATKLFDVGGTRLATPEVRLKPEISATDGVATSVSGFNPFFGTSAAAPSAAGVAALVRSAKPIMPEAVVAAIMKNPANTIDCTATAGKPDFDCGFGFILADSAVAQALDPTPPTVTPAFNPATPAPNGYHTGNVVLTWNVSDPGSPVAAATGCGPTTVSTDGSRTLTCTAVSAGGTTTKSVTVKRDSSPPSVAAIVNPGAPNGKNGYYTGNVGVSWNLSDPGSPIVARLGCGPTAITTDGTRTLTCTAVGAGTTSRSVTIKRDASRPKKPKIKGIKAKTYTRSKLPKKSKIKCTSSDPASGATCKVRGYSKKRGKHKLTATATNGAGLTSKRTLKYRVK